MFSRRLLPCLATLVFGLLTACGQKAASDELPKTASDYFDLTVGARTVHVQVAALSNEQERGLMFRDQLGAEEGMLFVFTRAHQQGFWMRNTKLPLDIGYFDSAGVLKEIYPMYPHDERTVASRSHDIQFCLEMNQGWFQGHGVKAGDQLDLKLVAAALKARGLKPEDAGLR